MSDKRKSHHKFDSEGSLCDAFIETVPDDYEIYAETAGYDIVLAHKRSEFQIAIEAKLRLNPKALVQVMTSRESSLSDIGPDVRAVLVSECSDDMKRLAQHLGVTVITVAQSDAGSKRGRYGWNNGVLWDSYPKLPVARDKGKYVSHEESRLWQDLMPERRIPLPDYVPDVKAGRPSPLILSDWKIASMKMIQWLEKNGHVTRAHFKKLGLATTFWMDHKLLVQGSVRGQWLPGQRFQSQKDRLRQSHSKVWHQIEDDFEKWSSQLRA